MPYTNAIAAGLNVLPSGVVGSMLKHVDFVASNVPGFPFRVYLAGAPVERYVAFGPTIGSSMNITLLSYAGTCCVGMNIDIAAVPDPEVLRPVHEGGVRGGAPLGGHMSPSGCPSSTRARAAGPGRHRAAATRRQPPAAARRPAAAGRLTGRQPPTSEPRGSPMDHMSPLDSVFLHMEDGITHMHIGSCAVFEGPAPAYEELVALVASKLPLLTRYRQKVRFVPGGLGRPVWVDDPHFNLAYHVRHSALPPPGLEPELNALMGRLMSQELDRHRPLWEAWMIEGLPDGRWAIISKVHHCMVDGISGTDLMALLLDPSPEPSPPPADQWTPAPEPSDAALVIDALEQLVANPYEQLRAARAATRAPRRAIAFTVEAFRGMLALGNELRPSPPLSIQGPIGPHRRWAAARSTLADIKAVRRALGGTVNDVVLSAITGAFRHLLLARGDPPDHAVLRSLVPVSVRAADDRTRQQPGDGHDRRAPHRRRRPARAARGGATADGRAQGIAPGRGRRGDHLARRLRGAHAPGPRPARRAPRWRGGSHSAASTPSRRTCPARSTRCTPPAGRWSSTCPSSRSDRACASAWPSSRTTAGVSFGVTGDFDAVPEVDAFCRQIESEIAELLELARQRTQPRRAPGRGRAAPRRRPPADRRTRRPGGRGRDQAAPPAARGG